MNHRLADLAHRLGGTLCAEDADVRGFATDSQAVRPGDLFLAIQGARVDGHAFVDDAIRAGAVAAVVEREVAGPHVRVANLVEALAAMARTFRQEFRGPVVGITGSAGKTTTKEFLAAALATRGPVLKTLGNRNTEYTSPLLWAEAEPTHATAIVEMAMRGFGQIRHLADFTQPEIGVITNIGFAHLEQVGSRDGIAAAKGELLEAMPAGGVAVLWAEDDFLTVLRAKAPGRTVTFGFSEGADCAITGYHAVGWNESWVTGRCQGRTWEVRLTVPGRHVALNASAAILAAAEAGIEPERAAAALADAELPPMRMEVREVNGVTLLLDTYNASPPGVLSALETLATLTPEGRRFAVLGEMRELGEHTEAMHRQIGAALATWQIDASILIGEPMRFAFEAARAAGASVRFANGLDDIRAFLAARSPGDAVLIKGSRALELERALT